MIIRENSNLKSLPFFGIILVICFLTGSIIFHLNSAVVKAYRPIPTPKSSSSLTCSIIAVTGRNSRQYTFTPYAYYKFTNDYVNRARWDFNGDGLWDTPFKNLSLGIGKVYYYQKSGSYTVRLQVITSKGIVSNICTKVIRVY